LSLPRPPHSSTLFPYTTLFRSLLGFHILKSLLTYLIHAFNTFHIVPLRALTASTDFSQSSKRSCIFVVLSLGVKTFPFNFTCLISSSLSQKLTANPAK